MILILSDQATPVTGQTLSVDRFRDIPAVKPVVRSLAATAALFAPPAHSRMMRAQKARDRELPGCSSSCRKVISCSGLATSSWFGGGPRGFDICTKSSLRYLYKLFMTHQTGWAFPSSRGGPRSVRCPTAEWVRNSRCRAPDVGELRFRLGLRRGRACLVLRSSHD